MSWRGRMTGEHLMLLLQQMTREERAAQIIVHLDDEETGDEHMGEPVSIHHEYDCNDEGVLRLNVSTKANAPPQETKEQR